MDKRLSEAPYLAGDYSIADIATFPWSRAIKREPEELDKRPSLKRWLEVIGERPAVKRGRMVNRATGPLEGQLRERHAAGDFETKTQDKIDKHG